MTQTLANWINTNKVATITFDPNSPIYDKYGISSTFKTVWNNFKNAVSTQEPSGNRRYPQTLQLRFSSDNIMTLRVTYLNNAQTSTLFADYDFDLKSNTSNGEVIFSKRMPEGTTTAHGNGGTVYFKDHFERFLLPYFTNRIFIADWLPSGISSTDPLYRTYGGFYEKELQQIIFMDQ
ncbi:hypothetical protein KUH03_23465 [Sphingobacterium sp. E70]|uniref:hypothetical protein n=1 Tax=Sphingobacterium sp. E70 TaxID=2853439 RepID=UPI00211B94B4|nr:hypothetical protein [Sphingobacterium sp. E70]ULT22382.1 hypothetical protein KUH03_23465 [Sphingobacterium sp. E70]